MPYIRESALAEINQAQHDALEQADKLRTLAQRLKSGVADRRDAPALEKMADKLSDFAHIVTEPTKAETA